MQEQKQPGQPTKQQAREHTAIQDEPNLAKTRHSNELEGKVAIVTGSGRGIGSAIAIELANRGAAVAINYSTSEADAAKVAEQIREGCGAKPAMIRADLSKLDQIEALVSLTYDQLGGCDILVNNAGIEKKEPFWDVTEADFQKVIDVDLKAVFFMTQAVVRRWLRDKVSGKILNISSVHEQIPFPGYASYCAAKGGVGMLTKTLALELAPYGIHVNGLAPGAIETQINASLLSDPERLDALTSKIPLRRMGTPEDVARVAAFLVGPESSYVTASTYYVDGGLTWNYEE